MEQSFDLAIVGGGLAGMAAARAAARQGCQSIAVVEKKAVGDTDHSPLTFCDTLRDHGLADVTKHDYSQFTFANYAGSSVRWEFDSAPLAVLDYKSACQRYLDETRRGAQEFELITDTVTSVEEAKDSVTARLKRGNPIRAKVLIDASGGAGLTRECDADETVYYNHAYGAVFEDLEAAAESECILVLPSKQMGSGGAWYYTLGPGKASFGVAEVTTDPRPDARYLKKLFRTAMKECRPYSELLHQGTVQKMELGSIPLNASKQFVRKRVLSVGDAAGIATNWTCMGTEPCLRYGQLAGVVACEAIEADDTGALNRFQETWDSENRETYSRMESMHSYFWQFEHGVWEWIIKNDLRFLSTSQILARLRSNGHRPTKPQLLWRAVVSKARNMLDSRYRGAMHMLNTENGTSVRL